MMNSNMDLLTVSKSIRRSIVKMAHRSYASHSGSALSIVDILTVLYFKVLNVWPDKPSDDRRDRFILSKGHASAALYATLAERGFFAKELLDSFYLDGGALPGHVDHTVVPGIDAAAGSLGHGLSLGAGIAQAIRMDKRDARVFVLMGDGELNEGSVWEAFMFIAHHKMAHVTAIVDCNKYQGFGASAEVLDLEPLDEKMRAFGWNVIRVDGHNFGAIEQAFQDAFVMNKPTVVLADTVKGKGVSYMEGEFVWHYKSPNDEQLLQALGELE